MHGKVNYHLIYQINLISMLSINLVTISLEGAHSLFTHVASLEDTVF